ncbi:MAG: MMPL family transporter [Deltaproteobacteria bacterium]|nr:MMPL family transporter [Deltaproteobacteria bacterium]
MQIVHNYTKFIIKRPVITLIALVAVTVVMGFGLPRMQFDASLESFVPVKDVEYQKYKKVTEIYGDVDNFVILDVAPDNLFSENTFREIDNLLTDLEEFRHYDDGREEDRLARLKEYRSQSGVRYDDVIRGFAADPGFSRFLKRTLNDAAGENEIINPRRLSRLYDRTVRVRDLKKLQIVDKIISPFTSKDIIGKNDTLITVNLIDKDAAGKRILPASREDFEIFKKRLTRNPVFERGIYSRDPATGEITDLAFIIRFSKDSTAVQQDALAREILKIVDGYVSLNITSQGQPLVYVWMIDTTQKDFERLIPLSFLIVVLVFFLNFRSLRGVILPTLTLSMATIWDFGLMGYLGVKITALCTSLPPLLICVGSAYSIHVLNQYYDDLDMIKTKDKTQGLLASMSHINLTVGLAGFTTIISFWTILNHQLTALRVWSLFSGLGVAFAVFIAMTLIPASLSLLSHANHLSPKKKKKAGARRDPVDILIGWLTWASLQHPGKVLAAVVVAIVLSVAGVFMVRVETEPLQYFKEGNYVRTSEKIIGEKFGGRWGFNVLIDSGEPDGIKTSRYLNILDDARKWLESDENKDLNVGRTDAFSDYIRIMHMAMNNDSLEYFSIPSSDDDIRDYLEIYSDEDKNSDGRIDDFEAYVDQKYQTCNILTRLCQREDYFVGTERLERIFYKISNHLKETLPPHYSYTITGHPMLVIKSAGYITGGQLLSLFQSMVVIGAVVLILVRHIGAGLLALIPLLLAVTLNFGIMGWFGIPLDVATSVIAAITIGIGDDVTIHFINTWRHLVQSGLSVDDSIRETLRESGKANIYTALALMAGFSVCFISAYKPIILFGFLMGIVLVANNIGALLILPSVIKLIGLDLNTAKKKESP